MVAGLPVSRSCHPEPMSKRHEGGTSDPFCDCEVRRRRNTRDFRTTWKVKNSPGLQLSLKDFSFLKVGEVERGQLKRMKMRSQEKAATLL